MSRRGGTPRGNDRFRRLPPERSPTPSGSESRHDSVAMHPDAVLEKRVIKRSLGADRRGMGPPRGSRDALDRNACASCRTCLSEDHAPTGPWTTPERVYPRNFLVLVVGVAPLIRISGRILAPDRRSGPPDERAAGESGDPSIAQ